jgi:hypothetical protein
MEKVYPFIMSICQATKPFYVGFPDKYDVPGSAMAWHLIESTWYSTLVTRLTTAEHF